MEPLAYLGVSLASKVPLFILFSDSECDEEAVPPEVDLRVELPMAGPALLRSVRTRHQGLER